MTRDAVEPGDRPAGESHPLAFKEAEAWGLRVAREIVADYGDAAAIDTACYRVCGFVIAAAHLALVNPSIARLIAESMEPPREMDR